MKISIITAVFNGEKFIRKTVESILSQKGDFELEYIVFDGQSTDHTLEILKEYPECRNVNAHGWLHGINQVLISPFPLEEKERKMFFGRVRRKVLEPAELYRYKSALRWREEPFSAIRYPIYFNNRHPHAIRFAEGFGSAINYADVNETAHMILATGQMLADRHGQKDFVRANGSYFRSAARFLLVSDDWAYMASHCRESGESFDMIILDPPKFIDSKNALMRGCRAYKDIALLAFRLLKSGGILVNFSCSGLMERALFQKITADAALDAGREALIVRELTQAPDHPVPLSFPEGLYLKGFVSRVC